MKKSLSPALLALAAAAAVALAPATALAAEPAAAAKPAKPAAKAAAKPADKAAPAAKTAKGKSKAKNEPKAADDTGIPEDVRQQMTDLIQKSVQLASPALQQGDEFLPYGVLMLKDGELKQVQWKQPNPPPVREVLRGIFITMMREAAQNPEVIAAVTVAPSMVSATTDAGETVQVHGLRAEVDHRDGAPRLAFMPYARENGAIVFGTSVYQVGPNPLFDHGQAAAPAGAANAGKAGAPAAAKPAAAETPATTPAAAPAP